MGENFSVQSELRDCLTVFARLLGTGWASEFDIFNAELVEGTAELRLVILLREPSGRSGRSEGNVRTRSLFWSPYRRKRLRYCRFSRQHRLTNVPGYISLWVHIQHQPYNCSPSRRVDSMTEKLETLDK